MKKSGISQKSKKSFYIAYKQQYKPDIFIHSVMKNRNLLQFAKGMLAVGSRQLAKRNGS